MCTYFFNLSLKAFFLGRRLMKRATKATLEEWWEAQRGRKCLPQCNTTTWNCRLIYVPLLWSRKKVTETALFSVRQEYIHYLIFLLLLAFSVRMHRDQVLLQFVYHKLKLARQLGLLQVCRPLHTHHVPDLPTARKEKNQHVLLFRKATV